MNYPTQVTPRLQLTLLPSKNAATLIDTLPVFCRDFAAANVLIHTYATHLSTGVA